VDGLAMERLGVPGLLLMENAGRQVADAAAALWAHAADATDVAAGPVVVLAGGGNNGGDGFVCARHLIVRGLPCVTVLLQPAADYTGDAATNLRCLQAMAAPIEEVDRSTGVPPVGRMGVSPMQLQPVDQSFISQPQANEILVPYDHHRPDARGTHGQDARATHNAGGTSASRCCGDALSTRLAGAGVIVDAIGGTGIVGPLRPALARAVEACNGAGRPVVAVDIPTGLDCDSGLPTGPCIRATCTVTFVAPKRGFENPASREFSGEIIVADIGVPGDIT